MTKAGNRFFLYNKKHDVSANYIQTANIPAQARRKLNFLSSFISLVESNANLDYFRSSGIGT